MPKNLPIITHKSLNCARLSIKEQSRQSIESFEFFIICIIEYWLTKVGLHRQICLFHFSTIDLAEISFIEANSLITFVEKRNWLIVASLFCKIVNKTCYQIHSGHCHKCKHKSFYDFLELSLKNLLANYIHKII